MRKLGPTQQKFLLMLSTGVALGLSHSPNQYFRILKIAQRDWKRINKRSLHRLIRTFHDEKLIDCYKRADGKIIVKLSDKGKQLVYERNLQNFTLEKPKRWDRKWRLVMFDIPERKRQFRDIFRQQLKRVGFAELQASVFVYPYDCKEKMEELVQFFGLSECVRFVVAQSIDNEKKLRKDFTL